MGFSLTLSHIIMVIASVCLASLFSAYAFYTGNLVQNELAQNINNYKITVNIRLEIVYATINDTTTPPHFVIYAKNTGNLPFSDFTSLTVRQQALEAETSTFQRQTATTFGNLEKQQS
jgi:archaellum component FlaF (FlaF/FlaG flagellin family)